MEQRTNGKWWWLMGVGGLLGTFLATWLAPKMITWYFQPPAQYGFNCVGPIEWALTRFRWAQLGGLLVGGAVGLVLAFVLRGKSRREPGLPHTY